MNTVLGSLESFSGNLALRLTLEKSADRLAHQIEIVQPGTPGSKPRILARLCSVEGTNADQTEGKDWPSSPPLQSCSLEHVRPGRQAAFLVGMAGSSHWSASLETTPAGGELLFDFACRVQKTPLWVGTTYDLDSPAAAAAMLEQSGEHAAAFLLGDLRLCIQAEGTDEIPPATVNVSTPHRLRIACSNIAPITRAKTLRWRYRLSLRGSPHGLAALDALSDNPG